MRCKACDALLSPQDLRRFSENTKEYLDLCQKCFGTIEEDVQLSQPDEAGEPDDAEIRDDYYDSNS